MGIPSSDSRRSEEYKVTRAQVAKLIESTLQQQTSVQPNTINEIKTKLPLPPPKPPKPLIESKLLGKSNKDECSSSLDRKSNDFPKHDNIEEESIFCSEETNEEIPIAPSIQKKPIIENIWEPSEISVSHRKSIERKLVAMFDDLMLILESEDFDKSLRDCLEKAAPKYMTFISKRKKDILKSDHGIVIAGETSAGKSTLINKILGMRIFKGRNRESTSTVCKIRNSENVMIKTEVEMGSVNETDLSEIDITTDKGEKRLRDALKKLTDMTVGKDSKRFKSVDISMPVPFLKGNTIMVDTPGIGGSGKVGEKLMEYLPNAVSFIFVINVASAGGMQRDRLPEILRSISNLIMEDEMPCFDPRGVIFITNKWDSISKDPDDSSEEDEVEKTWQGLESSIHRLWPSVKKENIFRMNLQEVPYGYRFREETDSSREFQKFRHALENVINQNENIRMKQHFRYLKILLQDMYTGVLSRQELTKKSRSEQERKRKDHEMKIDQLKKKCRENGAKWRNRIKTFIEKQATESLKYMSSDLGKERILNPKNLHPIMEEQYILLGDEVISRVEQYVSNTVQCPDVVEEFNDIKDEILMFYTELSSEIEKMENEWKGYSDQNEKGGVSYQEESVAPYVAGVIATSPIWFPLLTAAVAIGIATLPFIAPVFAFLTTDSRKRKKNRRGV
ncbi:transmembrane GTPase Marf-like [Ostrea edulis]|uniref:transmembrane GTPase Marf-like n=1 Tax=Ostrea edulis TaxID=37623 RepID=UPI0024AF9506|nr:transmembrane GTPase Marf-like [Ostrea edulis]